MSFQDEDVAFRKQTQTVILCMQRRTLYRI